MKKEWYTYHQDYCATFGENGESCRLELLEVNEKVGEKRKADDWSKEKTTASQCYPKTQAQGRNPNTSLFKTVPDSLACKVTKQ